MHQSKSECAKQDSNDHNWPGRRTRRTTHNLACGVMAPSTRKASSGAPPPRTKQLLGLHRHLPQYHFDCSPPFVSPTRYLSSRRRCTSGHGDRISGLTWWALAFAVGGCPVQGPDRHAPKSAVPLCAVQTSFFVVSSTMMLSYSLPSRGGGGGSEVNLRGVWRKLGGCRACCAAPS